MKQRSKKRAVFRITVLVGGIYLFLLAILGVFQRKLIYLPARAGEDALIDQADRVGLLPWRDSDGALIGWRTAARAANRVVVFHGNAGHALHRRFYVAGLQSIPDGAGIWEVYLFEYPGYGSREGTPGREAFLQAGQRAIEELLADNRPLYLCGESIGSGVACALAAENPDHIAGLFLVTPFTTLADVAAHHMPIFPVRWLLRERYDNSTALQRYAGPIAVLLAGRDEVIPHEQGERLFRGYRGPKKLWVHENATHNTLDLSPENRWWQEASFFLLEHSGPGLIPQ
jgi:uncharacterized protein